MRPQAVDALGAFGAVSGVTVLTERTATVMFALSMVAALGSSYRPAVVPRKNQTDAGR